MSRNRETAMMKYNFLALSVLLMTAVAHAGGGDHSLEVKDAGVVILQGYFPTLFERLGFQTNGKFVSQAQQFAAVHALEELATGADVKDDSLLALDKVLCGVPVTEAVPADFTPTSAQTSMIESLITAAISNWTAIGATSVNGFRGNWLVRPGTLVETPEYWELAVEHRAYDLLLAKSPYLFSTIKYPWMTKPLRVDWKY
jgi:hypothetical protein